jgi:hypothetical protein
MVDIRTIYSLKSVDEVKNIKKWKAGVKPHFEGFSFSRSGYLDAPHHHLAGLTITDLVEGDTYGS